LRALRPPYYQCVGATGYDGCHPSTIPYLLVWCLPVVAHSIAITGDIAGLTSDAAARAALTSLGEALGL
jgi:hypothetical protein